jgi:PmbA protein
VNVPWIGFNEFAAEAFIVNTKGLERAKRLGSATLYVEALAARGDDRKGHVDWCLARRPAEIVPEKVGKEAALGAIRMLGAKQPSSGRKNLLFAPRPFAELLGIFSLQFSGKNAEEKRTPLAGRIGQAIGAKGLNIVDDATIEGGPASRPFDDEGIPSSRIAIVEDGVFRAFLHTSDTARRAGAKATGHGARGYRGVPAVAPSNLMIPAGTASPEELRAGAEIEIVSVTGSAGANPVSGEFSLPVLGFELAGGKRAAPLHNFTIAGSFEGLLKGVQGIGKDFEFGNPGMISAFGCGSILVSGVAVAGR